MKKSMIKTSDFSVWLRTGSNQADINRFRRNIEKVFFYSLLWILKNPWDCRARLAGRGQQIFAPQAKIISPHTPRSKYLQPRFN